MREGDTHMIYRRKRFRDDHRLHYVRGSYNDSQMYPLVYGTDPPISSRMTLSTVEYCEN